jgi:hypothetical protein
MGQDLYANPLGTDGFEFVSWRTLIWPNNFL